MKGIVCNQTTFNYLNEKITIDMLNNQQLMEKWCEPIISKTGEYFLITETEGIRREIILKHININDEINISEDDENWFEIKNNIII